MRWNVRFVPKADLSNRSKTRAIRPAGQRGRVGMPFDRTLVYGKAGGSAGELRSSFAIPAGTTSTTVTCGT